MRLMTDFPAPDLPEKYAKIVVDALWPRYALTLHLLASTGWSTRMEIALKIAVDIGSQTPHSMAIRRVFTNLESAGYVTTKVAPLIRSSRINLIRLTETGKQLCNDLGWDVVESEWDRLIRTRSAENALAYVANVLEFALQARTRGFSVVVAPEGCASPQPDLTILEKGIEYPVFIMGNHIPANWTGYKQYPKLRLVCSRETHRNRMALSCDRHHVAAEITDLETLIKQTREGHISDLWLGSTFLPAI